MEASRVFFVRELANQGKRDWRREKPAERKCGERPQPTLILDSLLM
jgi:hypothetical protein